MRSLLLPNCEGLHSVHLLLLLLVTKFIFWNADDEAFLVIIKSLVFPIFDVHFHLCENKREDKNKTNGKINWAMENCEKI